MTKIVALVALCVCFMVKGAGALDLPATPVQDAMRAGLLADKDEFKDEPATRKAPAEFSHASGRKSVTKAGLLSALVPGLGEWYVGHREKARFFFAGEAATWAGFAAFRIYGHQRQEDYIRFAATNANAHLEDKSDEFRDLVGFYEDLNQYNSFGRVFDPERPYYEDTPENHWRWQSEDDRAIYRHLKNRSREAYRRSDFMVGVAVVSRVLSVIDAIRDAKRANNNLDRGFSDTAPLKLEIDPLSPTRQVAITFRTPF